MQANLPEEVQASIAPSLFPIQLTDAYLYEVELARRHAADDDPKAPLLDASLVSVSPLDESRFTVLIQASLVIPYNNDTAISTLRASVAGAFQSSEPLDQGRAEEFGRIQAPVLLWPYLRSAVGELYRMTGIAAAPLPTLDLFRTAEALAQVAPVGAKEPATRTRRRGSPKARARK